MKNSPLILDLDGTFFRNDFFAEIFIRDILNQPFFTVKRLLKASNWLSFKKGILRDVSFNAEVLLNLRNEELFSWLVENKSNFSGIHIVTASPDEFIKKMYSNFKYDVFEWIDSVHGSLDINLKGQKKLDFIQEKFGISFSYVGDSKSDFVIFGKSELAVYVKRGKLVFLNKV